MSTYIQRIARTAMGLMLLAVSAGCGVAMAAEITVTGVLRRAAEGSIAFVEFTSQQATLCRLHPSINASCTRPQGVYSADTGISYTKNIKTHLANSDNYYTRIPVQSFLVQNDHGDTIAFTTRSPSILTSVESYTPGVNPMDSNFKVSGHCQFKIIPAPPNTFHTSSINPGPCIRYTTNSNIPERADIYVYNIAYISEGWFNNHPLGNLPNGVYRSRQTFTIGEGGDFDFGKGANVSDDTLTINIEITLLSDLKANFPPGSDRAVLEPQGGWINWLHQNKPPSRLYRDQAFRISSSSPFSIYLNCQYVAGNQCAIRNSNAHEVPIDVAVTLPSHFSDWSTNTPIQRISLPNYPRRLRIRSAPGSGDRAQLHFEAKQPAVTEMLKNPGTTYKGDVTVVFDAML